MTSPLTTNPSATYSSSTHATTTHATTTATELPGSMGAPDPQWLTVQRNAGATPAEITTMLVGNGWNADQAAAWSLRSLRSTDYHHLTYAGVTWMTGIAALSGATSLHYLIDGNPNPVALATAVTFFISTVPLAIWAMAAMRRVEERSAHAVWSPARRLWFATLATCSGLVGLVRLLHFVYIVAASLTGARAEPLDIEAIAQVAVTVGVTVPLFWWSMREWRHSALLISGLSEDRPDDRSVGETAARTS